MLRRLSTSKRNNSNETSDVFCLYAINDINNEETITEIKVVEVEADPSSKFNLPSTSSEPSEYTKHNFTDLKPLTFFEQLRLLSLYYLSWSNVLRYVSILLCVIWFVFNAYHVSKDYLQLNSLVVIDFMPSDTSRPPAVSICTQCLLCDSSIKQTVYYQDILENDLILAMLYDNGRENVSDDNSIPQVDVKIRCKYASYLADENLVNVTDCFHFTDVIVSLQKSRKCEIYPVSVPPKPKLVMEYVNQPTISFQVSGQMLYDNNSFVEIGIHSPSEMPISLDAIVHRLEKGKLFDIQFTKKEFNFRSGYEPKCAKYRDTLSNMSLPEEIDPYCLTFSNALESINGTPIYRSSAECFIYCMWRKLVDANHTINAVADLTLEITQRVHFLKEIDFLRRNHGNTGDRSKVNESFYLKFKQFDDDSDFMYMTSQQVCYSLCPSSCKFEQFPEILVQKQDYKFDIKAAYVFIQWSSPTFDRISYRESIGMTEALGELGGVIHTVLKISVVQILCYLVRIIVTRQQSPQYSCCLLNWFFRKRSYE